MINLMQYGQNFDRAYQRNSTVKYNLTEMADNNNTTTQKSNLKKAALRRSGAALKTLYPFVKHILENS